MSYLDNLLEGVEVEWKNLEDVAKFRRGSFPQPYGKTEWYDGDGAMPFVQVVDVGFDMKLVADTKNKISKLAQPKSVFVPRGTIIVTLQGSIGRVAVTQYDCYVDRTLAIFEDYLIAINEKYFAYQLEEKFRIEKIKAPGSTIKTITKASFSKFKIPIPCPNNPEKSLEIQNEIVRILDTFTELTAELTAALTARKQQYGYYREQLLRFEEGEVEWKSLGEVITLQRGKRLVKSQLEETGEYAVYQNAMKPLGYYHESNVLANTTFVICAGAAGEIGFSDVPYWAADDVHSCITPDGINNKYLYYYLLTQQHKISSQVRRASIPRLSRSILEKLNFPIPSLEEQKRIVSILDKFDILTTSLSEGLPKEIELRKKQYEYYRDMLLTFPKQESV